MTDGRLKALAGKVPGFEPKKILTAYRKSASAKEALELVHSGSAKEEVLVGAGTSTFIVL